MNLDFLQQLCNNWPGVTTDVKWGNDFVFSVVEKMFCVCSLEPPSKIAFKVKDEEFEELSVRDGFMPAPYMARNKWVLITNPGKLNRNEWEEFVKQSYELVKSKLPKKAQESLQQSTRSKSSVHTIASPKKQGIKKVGGIRTIKKKPGEKIKKKNSQEQKPGAAKKRTKSKTPTKKRSK